MKGNEGFETLVRYLDEDLKEILSDEQREHIYALVIRATASSATSTRKAVQTEMEHKQQMAAKAAEKPVGPSNITIQPARSDALTWPMYRTALVSSVVISGVCLLAISIFVFFTQ